MVDRKYVEHVSAESSFSIETVEKVLRLLALLRDVDKHPLLGNVLALKGGTALNLFYGPPPRMSVDLDFNYIGKSRREEMLSERPKVERAIEILAGAQQYRLQPSGEAHAGRTYHMSYQAVTGIRDRIQIDLNFFHRVPIGQLVRREAWAPDGTERPSATLVSSEELFAGKFCAFMDRVAPRDAFDMARIPELDGGAWSGPRARAVAVAMSGTLPHPLYQLSPRFESGLSPDIVEDRLYPMLTAADRPDPNALLKEARRAASPILEEPTDPEREYVERINRGELSPEVLFPDDDGTAELLRVHPALLWKAKNARQNQVDQ